MPPRIVALEDDPRVLRGQVRSLGRDVGDVVDLDLPLRLVFLGEPLEGTELPRKGHELVVGEALVAEAQQVVLLERVANARHRRGVQRLRQVDSQHLGAQRGRQAVDGRVGQRLRHRFLPCPVVLPPIVSRLQSRGRPMRWAAPRMTAYDLPIDAPLRPDVASRAARSVVGAAPASC